MMSIQDSMNLINLQISNAISKFGYALQNKLPVTPIPAPAASEIMLKISS